MRYDSAFRFGCEDMTEAEYDRYNERLIELQDEMYDYVEETEEEQDDEL